MIRWEIFGYTVTIELVIWLAIGFVGYVVSGLNILNGLKGKHQLEARGINGPARTLAVGFIRREIVRHLAQIANLALGAIAFTYPPGPVPTIKGEIFSALLIYIALSITVNSVLDRRARGHARILLEQESRAVGHGIMGTDHSGD